MSTPASCASCGAALAPGATQCDLCGTPVNADPVEAAGEIQADGLVGSPLPDRTGAEPVDCATCGHLNPAGARFCNQCGAALPRTATTRTVSAAEDSVVVPAVLPDAPEGDPGAGRPSSAPGKRALLYMGLGIGAVIALYFLTQRGSDAPAEEPRLTAAPATPPDPVALPDSLGARADALAAEGTAQSLNDAGGIYYRAAATLSPEDPQRAALAQEAVGLYEQSLALEDDADVRVNLAVAALLDPSNPMRTVQELQAVLDADPDHVEANFNMGLMRMQIGRLDAAAESFRRVIGLTTPSDPVHGRAQEALLALEGALEDARAAEG